MLPITRSARADEDLIEIWLHITTENPVAADRVLDAIEARWQQLAYHPRSGIARDDIAEGVRHLVIGQYLTLYRVVAGENDAVVGIEILRVLHGRRDLRCGHLD